MKRILIPSLILACSSIGYLSLSVTVRERLAGLFSLDHEIPVEVVRARKEPLGRILMARGEVLALKKEVRVNTKVSGIIKDLRFAAGEKIAAGAVVALIETKNTSEVKELSQRFAAQQAAIKEAEEQVKKNASRLAAAEKHLGAMRDLFQKDFIARREVELAEAAASTARAKKDVAEAQLAQRISLSEQTRHILSLTQITSPVAGSVTRRWVEPGAQVAEGATLLSVSQGETLKLLAHMKSSDSEKIRPGTPTQVVVDALPGKIFIGKVTQVHELANFSGDESSVEIEMADADGSLKTGMQASASFPMGEQRDAIFLPKEALIQTQGRESHLFVLEDGKARQRTVISGNEHASQIEVVSGLEPGEVVVVTGIERLRDGSRVLAVD